MGVFETIDKVGDGLSHVPLPINPFRTVRQAAEIRGGADPIDTLDPTKSIMRDFNYWTDGGNPYRPGPDTGPPRFPNPGDPVIDPTDPNGPRVPYDPDRYKRAPDPAPKFPDPSPPSDPGPGPSPGPAPTPSPSPPSSLAMLDLFSGFAD